MSRSRISLLASILVITYCISASIANAMMSSQPPSPTFWQEQWVFETVANSQGENGTVQDHSLAFDQLNNLHLSYYDSFDGLYGKLIYTIWDGTNWISETVENSGGARPTLVVDSSNNPHLSYRIIGPTNDIKYAHKDISGWLSETIAVGGLPTKIPIDLDENDFPHLIYPISNHLDYIYWTGSMWLTNTVAIAQGGSPAPTSLSLALDSNNIPHISFHDWPEYDPYNGLLKYARWNGTSWITETVTDAQHGTSLILDAANNPHIAFINSVSNGGQLQHIYWSDNKWEIEAIDENCYAPSLVLDSNGKLHVAYRANGNLMYAYQTESGWESNILLQTDVYEVTLVLNNEGSPYIAFYDGLARELVLAHKELVEIEGEKVFLPFIIK